MKNRIRRFISLLVSFALFVGQFSLSSFAANEIQPISNAQEYYYESFYNTEGQLVEIKITQLSNGNIVEVYLDGVITQIVTADYDKDLLSLQNIASSSSLLSNSQMSSIQEFKISDFVCDSERNYSQLSTPDLEDWAFYRSYPPTPLIDGAKGCDLYVRNYDEEPDLHRYNGKSVQFTAGTAVGIIASVLSVFLSGNVTISSILVALGTAVVADAISKAIDGDVCFSTKKILYAPIVGGQWIFGDAYITERWVIIYDYLKKVETFELDDPSYQSNRGTTPSEIAVNAQIEEYNLST